VIALAAMALLALAGGAADEPSPPRAASVRMVLAPGEDPAPAEALLDVAPGAPVTLRAVRRTALRLFQAGRCRDVVVEQAEAAPPPGETGRWVALTVTCAPHRLMGALSVVVEGPSPLDVPALRAAAALEAGGPADDADLEAAAQRVRAALHRRGHRAAEVALVRPDEQASAVVLRVRAGEATRIAAVRLPGAGAEEAALLGQLALRPGAVLDEDRLAEDVARLRRGLNGLARLRGRVGAATVKDGPAGAEVSVPVELGPVVRLEIRGARAVAARDLRAQLEAEAGETLDAQALDAALERLRAYYRARGFASARLEVEELRRGEELRLVLHVDEGRPLRLAELRWEGAGARSEEALRERLLTILAEDAPAEAPSAEEERLRAHAAAFPAGPRPFGPPTAREPGTVLDEVALEHAAERIVEEYRADGYLEAALLGWSAEEDLAAGTVAVTLRLREGERTTVESIGFEGNVEIPLPELARESRLAPGAPLTADGVEATRQALLRLYLGRSYLYARVEVRQLVDPLQHVATLRYVVSEGPRVRLGRVLITGNVRTRDDVVRRALEVKEGAFHDPEAMARSQAALLRLGVFRSVGLRLQDPEVPEPVKDLVVEVAERPWQYVAPGAGYSIANGPRLFLEYGRPNLLGRALELTARAKVNYPLPYFGRTLEPASPKNTIEGRADVGLRAPRLDPFPWPVSGRANLIAERIRRAAYDLKRASGILGVDTAVASRVALSLQYEIEVDEISKGRYTGVLTEADLERLRFDAGTTTLHAIRPSLTLDFRDNAAHPRRGWYASGSAELAHSLGGPGGQFLFFRGSEIFTSMAKLDGTLSAYLPIGPSTVVALSARGGRVIPLDPNSRTIIPKRFFLGGASTDRGFAEDEMIPEDLRAIIGQEAAHCATSISGAGCTDRGRSVAGGALAASEGGELYVLLKAELRLTLRGNLEAGFFADVGNLWLDPARYRLLDARPSVGVGLRFVTPVGPAAFDLGFNLSPDHRINERSVAPHFTIGLF
jgi:outer membrane protein insertion porin family